MEENLKAENEELKNKIVNLENQINSIKKRNQKVEGDKAWETSLIRIVLIIFFTYYLMSSS